MRRAVVDLDIEPDYLIIDGNIKMPDLEIPRFNIKGGDRKCYFIAAASIVAKVERDRVMQEAAEDYPEYGFEDNKGYGTQKHFEAVRKHGYSSVHRRYFFFHEKDQLRLGL